MIFLGFGKYARADKIYAIEPIRADRRLSDRADDPPRDGPVLRWHAAARPSARSGGTRCRADAARPRRRQRPRPPGAEAARVDREARRNRAALLAEPERAGATLRARAGRLRAAAGRGLPAPGHDRPQPAARVAAVSPALLRPDDLLVRRRDHLDRGADPAVRADPLDSAGRTALLDDARPAAGRAHRRRRRRRRGRS